MENKDSKGTVKEVNECVGDKVEKNGRKMSAKNSAMTDTTGHGVASPLRFDLPHLLKSGQNAPSCGGNWRPDSRSTAGRLSSDSVGFVLSMSLPLALTVLRWASTEGRLL